MTHQVSIGLATHRIKVEGTLHTREDVEVLIQDLLSAARTLARQAKHQHRARRY